MLMRRLVAEYLGTAALLCTVVGSGILIHKLDAGNTAVTVFAIAAATGLVLYALIEMLGSISAHFNPIVTLVNALQKNINWSAVVPYFAAQILGAITGVVLANLMFEQAPFAFSETARTGTGQWLGEWIATFGLIGVITGCSRFKPAAVPQAVSAYVAGAIMFTSSTCFANPAVTISRMFTTTITGIRPADVPVFIVCEVLSGVFAMLVFSWLCREETAKSAILPNSVEKLEKELAVTR